jgi:hypothetical protein
MKKYILITLLLLCANIIHAQSPKQSASPKAHTITKGYSADAKYQAKTRSIARGYNADTNYQSKEVSKEYAIAPNVKIYIETGNRDINIKTWNEPTVKIVATYFYTDSAQANLSLDDIFSKSNISVKSSDNAFQILAASPLGVGSWRSPNNIYFIPDDTKAAFKNSDHSWNKDSLDWNDKAFSDSLQQDISKDLTIITKGKTKKIEGKKFEKKNEKELAQLPKDLPLLKLAQLNKESLKLAGQAHTLHAVPYVQGYNIKELQSGALKMVDDVRYVNVVNFGNPKNRRHWDIYIPAGHALEIENKSGNIHIENDMNNVKIISEGGNIEVPNVETLNIRSKFGDIRSRNIQKAIVTLEYGKFVSGDIQDLKIDSKFSNIDLNKVKNINMVSTNDDYDIDEAGKINAEKKYGVLRIASLKDSLSLNGANADIKLRNISPDASFIKIDNKYADIRLSLDNIKNYSLHSTDDNVTSVGGTGAGTKIEINCTSCRLGL